MKHLLLTIAAFVLVGCGEKQPPEPPDISIHDAANDGNIEAVKQHLADGADVNAKNRHGDSPLHLAAQMGHKEIVELLIAKGADVNAKNDYGETPLDGVETFEDDSPEDQVNYMEIADLIRKHGGKSGAEVSIHSAAKDYNVEAVKEHLAAGTNVNAKNTSGQTPLHWAAGSGTKEVT